MVSFKPLTVEVGPKREGIFGCVEKAMVKAEAIMNSEALLKFPFRAMEIVERLAKVLAGILDDAHACECLFLSVSLVGF